MNRARRRRIAKVEHRLLRKRMPRFQISLILLFTGLAGFLTSFSLLHLGIPWMWLRYPISILLAYCVFLLLLRLWLWLHRTRSGTFDLGFELVQSASEIGFPGSPGCGEGFEFSGGGDAGG